MEIRCGCNTLALDESLDLRPGWNAGGLRVCDTVVVERGDVARAKPEPDLFLECQERLGVEGKDCYVIGDAVWDLLAARRAGMLSVGLLSGGYDEDELVRAGAFRVFRDRASASPRSPEVTEKSQCQG